MEEVTNPTNTPITEARERSDKELYNLVQDVIFEFGNKHSPHYVVTSYGSRFDTHSFCLKYARKLEALLTTNTPSTEEREKLQKEIKSICSIKHLHNQDMFNNPKCTGLNSVGIDSVMEEIDKYAESIRQSAESALIEKIRPLLVDEDLNAPIDRNKDGNPESDAQPDIYIVRRATRNLYRAELRKALNIDQEGEDAS